MATSLRSTIDALAAQFASGVLSAIRSASLEEILEETGARPARPAARPARAAAPARRPAPAAKAPAAQAPSAPAPAGKRKLGKGGRLARRSAKDIGKMLDQIVALLQKSPGGLRAEQIRDGLGLLSKELPRPLAEGVRQKRFSKKGQKRATTYFIGAGGAKASAPKAAAPKAPAPKAGKRGGKGKKG
jgi:hypothetical protein